MRQAVLEDFPFFSRRFEGSANWMYLDILGLVTTGLGNLIDPLEEEIFALPWEDRAMMPASRGDILTEWGDVKALQAHKDGPLQFWTARAKLRLPSKAIDELVMKKLHQFEAEIKALPQFKKWDDFCADAQLAILSMAWAMGVGGFKGFPMFNIAVVNENWGNASNQCRMDDHANAGLRPRNDANQTLLRNAAAVKRMSMDPDVLYYPRILQ